MTGFFEHRSRRWAIQIAAIIVMLFSIESLVTYWFFDRAEIARLAQLSEKSVGISGGYWRFAEVLTTCRDVLTFLVALSAALLARRRIGA